MNKISETIAIAELLLASENVLKDAQEQEQTHDYDGEEITIWKNLRIAIENFKKLNP